MEISIIGTGYVGLPAGAGLAKHGHNVRCVDIDEEKVEKINKGECPIFEEGLPELLEEVVSEGKLEATTDTGKAVKESDITFLAVGTPMREDGSINLDYIKQAAEDIAEGLKEKEDYHVIVVKSTVVPTTTEEEIIPVLEEVSGKKAGEDFGVCMNPEFLREGTALNDFLEPDRIVIGELDGKSGETLEQIYEDFDAPVMRTSLKAAELIKYASNSLLATKVSFINEVGNLCKELGIDVYEIADGVGMDHRIERKFLNSGAGFGGSCLTGDQEILVKEDGQTRLVRIEEFFEEKKGESPEGDIKAISCNDEGEFEFKPIQKATSRDYQDEIYTIKTSMNKEVEVTKDHPMLVVEDGNLELKKAEEVEKGDRIPVLSEIPEDSIEYFDLLEIISNSDEFKNDEVYLKPSFEIEEIEKELREYLEGYNQKFSYDKIRDFRRGNYIPLDAFLKVEKELELKRSDFRIYTSKGATTYIPAVIYTDQDFWRFIGYYLSEGHINEDNSGHGPRARERIMLSFHPEDEQEYVEDVEEYLEQLGIKHRTDSKETSTQICFSSRAFSYFLRWLGCGTGSYSAQIPDIAYQETEENRKALLSGLFRGDGYIEYTNHSNAVVYDYGSVSEELIQGMKHLLHSLGIVPSYKVSESSKSTKPAHFIRVSSKPQVEKLQEMFLEGERQKITQRLDSYDKEIRPTGHKKDTDFTTVKVKEIRKEKRDTEVYSLEVKDTHNFVTTDGLVVHNCFPKDVRALISFMEENSIEPRILQSTIDVNTDQKTKLVELLEKRVDAIEGKTVAVLGLAFKPGTDDVRKSPAIPIIQELKDKGAEVKAYDPEAMENMKEKHHPNIDYYDTYQEALENTDAALIVTDWEEFDQITREDIKTMNNQLILEGMKTNHNLPEDKIEGITWS